MQPCFQLSLSPPTRPLTPAKINLRAVQLGNVKLDSAIILAPMAGVTNPPFRKLCSEYGAQLAISEMLHASLYLSSKVKPSFNDNEIRSVQLYGTDATTLSGAAMRLVQEEGVDHIDLNFGCPAPKILRRGGGAAIPGDIRRFEEIVKAVVQGSGHVPVSCKLRAGHNGKLTYKEAGIIAEASGVSAVTLHSRTAEELYERGVGRARWDRIGVLVDCLDIPVFGNGDVFSGVDAVEMVSYTGCSGVVVGRGCLGRPWLFDDILKAFNGDCGVTVPEVRVVLEVMTGLMVEIVGYLIGRGVSERSAILSVRKWYSWFLQGYSCKGLVEELMTAESLQGVLEMVHRFDDAAAIDICEVLRERGKLGWE